MYKPIILALWLLAMAVPAHSQETPAWVESNDRATVAKAGITVPLAGGTLKISELREFGKGGIDVFAQYRSADEAVFGTIFVYAPTMPDLGLTFLATDEVIRRRFGPGTRIAEDRLIPVAGVRDAGRRVIYDGAEGGKTASSAIFARAGSWIVVVRVSGPVSRAAEIKSGVDALLAGMTFPKGSEPLPAKVIRTEPCQAPDRTVKANIAKPTAAEVGAATIMAGPGANAVDRAGRSVLNPLRDTPDRLCLESIELQGAIALQIFRPIGASDLPYIPRLYAIYGDAGILLEVAEDRRQPGSFYVLRHGVGRMHAFGKLDRIPSIGQMKSLIAAPDEQPAIALFTSKFASADGGDTLHIYCDKTVEGCSSEGETARPQTP